MLAVVPALEREHLDARLLLQIHDELVFEVPPEQVEKTGTVIRRTMESALPLIVPLTVNLETGLSLAKR